MVMCDFEAAVGSGLKFSATTALGITETILGSSAARRTVFSLLGIGSLKLAIICYGRWHNVLFAVKGYS